MPVIRLEFSDLQATQRFGGLLSGQLRAGDVIALSGALGAGKSVLARAIIQAVDDAAQDDVPSPTFTLVQQYALADGTPLWHLDLYRIETPQEAMALGLDDAFIDAVCLIEWPDRLQKLLPKTSLSIHLYADDSGDGGGDESDNNSGARFADVTAPPHWTDRINDLVTSITSERNN
jgi:tRNA threonylcarbamoyladenosine biosynthesis protein TsaE